MGPRTVLGARDTVQNQTGDSVALVASSLCPRCWSLPWFAGSHGGLFGLGLGNLGISFAGLWWKHQNINKTRGTTRAIYSEESVMGLESCLGAQQAYYFYQYGMSHNE